MSAEPARIPDVPVNDVVAIDEQNPLAIAKNYVAACHSHDDGIRLRYWRGDWYLWTGSYYRRLESEAVRSGVYTWLELHTRPNKRLVDFVLDALRSYVYLDAQPPAWLTETRVTGELIPVENGLLEVETRTLHPPTPAYFNLHAAPFAYSAVAPTPSHWLAFLDSVWGNDPESIACLQELFGLLLTTDTSFQKIILLIGPKRSGKGTVARVLKALLGGDNVTAPTLSSLGQPFGLASLIGKLLAIVSDARLSGRSDIAAVAENLLRVSGEDAVAVPRKFQVDWIGTLPTRFLLMTNEIPALNDASGALASRFLVVAMTESFFGREDRSLSQRLLAELPGIFGWALDGLDRLRARGHLLQPASGLALHEQLDRLSSPIKSFVTDECVLDPAAEIPCKDLFAAWESWCGTQHRDHAGTLQMFGRNLSAAFPGIAVRRPRRGDSRDRVYAGVRLRRPGDEGAGPRWSATQTIARDASPPLLSEGDNGKDRGPTRTTLDLLDQAAAVTGVSADTFRDHLSAEELADPGLMTLEWLVAYAGTLRDGALAAGGGV